MHKLDYCTVSFAVALIAALAVLQLHHEVVSAAVALIAALAVLQLHHEVVSAAVALILPLQQNLIIERNARTKLSNRKKGKSKSFFFISNISFVINYSEQCLAIERNERTKLSNTTQSMNKT